MAAAADELQKTEVGNYFVSNYPPFSAWKPENVGDALDALNRVPDETVPLGLYLHIPFCRKRCKFCYFRVYTDKNSQDIEAYIKGLVREVEILSEMATARDRQLQFVYVGGGTPSYLSAAQLEGLTGGLQKYVDWSEVQEFTFECEPGTLQKHKLETIRRIGVTRLSLGIESFDDEVLKENGRAHLSAEVYRAYGWAREVGFPQINVDLISGMVGETEETWNRGLDETIKLDPDSVTIYQMELPFNTVYSRSIQVDGAAIPVADWPTKRNWVALAFARLGDAGYSQSSAYTMVKTDRNARFVYRDSLWRGADMFGTGVASFGHIGGVHVQNHDQWDSYLGALDRGEPPLSRAFAMTSGQRLIREMILQLKLGRIESSYFKDKFDVDIIREFQPQFAALANEGMGRIEKDAIILTEDGFLRIDGLLPRFFEPEYQNVRIT
jgi:oxygen-independent coproporphyrinogen-3 oxidase